MSNWKISRRHFISSTGTVLLLPLLETIVPSFARAAGEPDPRRFIGMYMPNGTWNRPGDQVWYPATGGLSGDLGAVLSPFANNRGDFSVLKNIGMSARDKCEITGGGHQSSSSTFLTGTGFTSFNVVNYCTVPGSSFDQMHAEKNGKPAMVVSGGNGYAGDVTFDFSPYLSFNNGKVVEPYKNPVYLYRSMFSNLVPTTITNPQPLRAAARNKSILDSSVADLNELKSQLGRSDNRKLDEHLTNLRTLETKLNIVQPGIISGRFCPQSTAPSGSLDNSDLQGQYQDYLLRMEAYIDMIVIGFQCDIIRSVSWMYDSETGGRNFGDQVPADLRYNGASLAGLENHIGISHSGGRDKCITRDRMLMSLMIKLINKLKAATDPSGSPILDNTLLLNGYAVTDGNHSNSDGGVPIIVGGGRNFINPGNSYDVSGYDLKDLLYTFNVHLNMGLSSFAGANRLMTI